MKNNSRCWCGNTQLANFSSEYGECQVCGTLVSLSGFTPEKHAVQDDEKDFYGKQYWLNHQQEILGLPNISQRSRNDLIERNLHWLKTLLKHRLPAADVLELGCSHGSFVALMKQSGYQAIGLEMSPWVAELGRKTFGVPILVGPVETQDLPLASFDVIAMMDVLEHLPDPLTTIRCCLDLLKPDGMLLIQTPQFREGISHESLVAANHPFLTLLQPDEHLYLFSDRSATHLFQQLGAEHIQFEPAIFAHYDMFFAVSRVPLATRSIEEIEASLTATPHGRLALALLDIYSREATALAQMRADKAHLINLLHKSEVDRAARIEVTETQGRQLGRIGELDVDVSRLQADEAAITAILLGRIGELEVEVSQRISQLQASEATNTTILNNWWIKLGRKIKVTRNLK